MSKKKNDQNFISELLGKLKASYSAPEEETASEEKDTSDAAFQKQLKALLGKTSSEESKSKKEEKKSVEAPKKKKAPVQKKTVRVTKKTPTPEKKQEKEPKIQVPEEPLFLPTEVLEEVPREQTLQEEPAISVMTAVEEVATEEPAVEPLPEEEPTLTVEVAPEEPSAPIEEAAPVVPQELPVEKTVTRPAASSVPEKKTAEKDPIVIRPKQSAPQRAPIVIRPRTESKPTPAPKKIEPKASEEPIRIGRKSEPTAPAASAVEAPKTQPAEKKKRSAPQPRVLLVSEEPKNTSKPSVKSAPAPIQEPAAREEKKILSKEELQKLPFSEQIQQKTGLSEEDLALLFELGYDGDLANLVGTENLKKLKSANLRKMNDLKNEDYPTAYGYRGKEYTGAQDQSGVLAAYVHDRKHLIARLILSALCSLLLLFVEIPALRSTRWTQMAQKLPLLFPILGILLLTVTAALSAKQLWAGAKKLSSFSASPYSVCSALLLPTLIYDVLALFLPAVNLPVNFLVSLAILALVVCDVFRLWGEIRVFRLLSKPCEKNVLELIPPRKRKMKYGDKILKILNDEIDERFYRISKARETTGVFRRFNTSERSSKTFSVLILTAVIFPLIWAFAVAIYTLSLSAAINAFISVLILGAPISALFGVFYPLFHSNRLLTRHQCALIGEESAEEYCRPKTLVFEDSAMFHTEKCTEIALDESGDFQNDMKLASALFRKIGSTLDPLGQAVSAEEDDTSVSLLRILENGVEATVNKHHMMAGDASFFKRYGIRVPKESSDRALRRTQNVRVFYVAIDGVLKLNYEIEYTEKITFEKLAEALLESKTAVSIRSYDPNLNTAFVQELRNGKGDALRVIKPGRYEENCTLDLVDTGAVSLDSPEKTVCALHAAAKIGKLQSLTARLQWIATLLGGIGAFLLLVYEGVFPSIPQIVFYHLFWIAVSFAATHLEITEEKLHLLK